MKKIYIVNATISHGGAERVISILANFLVEREYEISIFTWLDMPVFYQLDEHVKVICIQKECNSHSLLKKMLWFRKYVSRNKPHILFSFLAIFNIVTLFSLIGVKVKTIVCERNDPRYTPFGKINRLLRNFMYNYADGILTQTENNKTYFSTKLQKKTTVIYNPILLDSEIVGKSLTVHKNKTIISVARLTPQKNQQMLIEAFASFSKKYPDYDLVIYGEGSSRDFLVRLVKDLKIQNKVSFPGVVKNVFDYVQTADMFVLSSNFEGMPNTLLEAMCIGLPCISTKVSGAVDLIKDGVNGFLVEIGNKKQMEERMCRLADSQELRSQMGREASKLYTHLNVDVICKKWENYIRNHI